jgi:hypothetical protein
MLYLAVGKESVCAELQTSGEFCLPDVLHNTTDYSDGQQNTYFGVCPCAAGLICSSAVSNNEDSDVSNIEKSSVSPIFPMFWACKDAEPETDEGEPAD